MSKLPFVVAIWLALLYSAMLSADPKIYFTSLEWPPYSGEQLPARGASVAVAKAAFKAMSYELVVDFFPWSRAVKLARSEGSRYAGYFPEYFAAEIATDFIFSNAMGRGPLGFVQRKSAPVSWDTLDDLDGYTIGTVQDYVNTQAFDQRVSDGRIAVQTVIADRQNVLKVAAGRVPLAVIDKNVLDYLLLNDQPLRKVADRVEFNPRLLAEKQLYLCFRKGPEGERLVKIFNAGLEKIDIEAVMSDYLRSQ